MAERKVRIEEGSNFEDTPCPPVRLEAQAHYADFLKGLQIQESVRECCHCGTEIEFETDRCPICGTLLVSPDKGIVEFLEEDSGPVDERGSKMDPIIHSREVVFLHLDVSTGVVDYLKRLENGRGFGQATAQVPIISVDGRVRPGER